jgi:hypothetical protein
MDTERDRRGFCSRTNDNKNNKGSVVVSARNRTRDGKPGTTKDFSE